MKSALRPVYVVVVSAFLASCSSVTPDATELSPLSHDRITKKCDNPPCGGDGGDGLQPANVTVHEGDVSQSAAGIIVDPDGSIRIGSDYDVGMDFEAGSNRGTSTSCPGVTFGIIEVGVKRGALVDVIVWGTDSLGDQVTSGRQPVAEPATPTPNVDFTFHVHLDDIPITKGRGRTAEFVCSVAIGDLFYDFI